MYSSRCRIGYIAWRNLPTQLRHSLKQHMLLQVEWTYLQRVITNCATAFVSLTRILFESFMPIVTGGSISEQEKALLFIPVQMSGMGI